MSSNSQTLSIVALILALVAGGILGIIVGIIARKKEGPNGLNMAAIVIGIIEFIIVIAVLIWYFTVVMAVTSGLGGLT